MTSRATPAPSTNQSACRPMSSSKRRENATGKRGDRAIATPITVKRADGGDDDRGGGDRGDRRAVVDAERPPRHQVGSAGSHRAHERLSDEHDAADEHGDGEEHQRPPFDVGDLPHRSDAEEVLDVLDVHGMAHDRLDAVAERREVVRSVVQVDHLVDRTGELCPEAVVERRLTAPSPVRR